MKTLWITDSLRRTLALGLVALTAITSARQGSRQGPETEEERERLIRDKPKSDLASKLETEAREAFRTRRYADAERLASRSAALFESTLFPELSIEDHQILAETYLVNKRYNLALAETLPWKGKAERGRFGATKAIALLGLGRTVEARRLLVAMVGTPEDPGGDRPSLRLPMDEDASEASLLASAYVVRAYQNIGSSPPEVFDDLKAAEALSHGNPCVLYDLAFCLAQKKRFEEARVYYARVASINEPNIHRLGEAGVANMNRAISMRDKARANGVKAP